MNTPELLYQERTALLTPQSGHERQKPLCGRDAHKCCDRHAQRAGFSNFFKQKRLAYPPRQPQFYWLCGDAEECLDSFIESLKAESPLKDYASVRMVNIPWPRIKGKLEMRKDMLANDLCAPFLLNDITPEHLAETLCERCMLWKDEAVILIHDIHAADWNAQNEEFVRWYISECWGRLECRDDLPQVLIFFNMIYPVRHGNSLFSRFFRRTPSKKRIAEHVRKLHETAGDPDPCQMLEEFRSVEREDVHNWFVRHGYGDEPARLELLDRLFQEQGHPVERKPMSVIQKALERFVKEQGRLMAAQEERGQYPQASSASPLSRLSDVKRERLQRDMEQYRKQYEAVSQQKRNDVNAMNQISLQSQMDEIEQNMRDIERELDSLSVETPVSTDR